MVLPLWRTILHKKYVNNNWKSKLIQKFASRQRGHILWLICVVFSLSDNRPLMLTTKKQLVITWWGVQQNLAKWAIKNSHIFKYFSESPSCKSLYTPSCFSVLDKANNLIDLKLKEALYINTIKPNLNKQVHHFLAFFFSYVFSFITSIALPVIHTSLLLNIYSLTSLQYSIVAHSFY